MGTWNRECECSLGYEPGGATGCQRCSEGSAISELDVTDERGEYKDVTGQVGLPALTLLISDLRCHVWPMMIDTETERLS